MSSNASVKQAPGHREGKRMTHVIVGTAGHIDHGKTALIEALTGINTDTLPEERIRGMTIDVGFAYWKDHVTIIDVPGHERFVKNMVTGVSSVDMALFVVAADDGTMPQTREHLDILNLLGVQRGVVALNKIDLVDSDWMDLVSEDLRDLVRGTFLEGAPVVPVSSITGEGIDQIRLLLETEIAKVVGRPDRGIFRLPVDRAFSVRGFGTVATGTVLSGGLRPKDEVEILPSGKQARIRSLQVHGKDVDFARVGQRTAANLGGVELGEVRRGDVLTQPGQFGASYMLDARLRLLRNAPVPLKNRTRVRLHLGPREVLTRVILLESEALLPGEEQLAQLRLESPGVAAPGDRFVIRRYSPTLTIGGGVVLDLKPAKHKRFSTEVIQTLRGLGEEEPAAVLEVRLKAAAFRPKSSETLALEMGLGLSEIEKHLNSLVSRGRIALFHHASATYYIHADFYTEFLVRIEKTVVGYHRKAPLRPGIAREALRLRVKGAASSVFFDHCVECLLRKGVIKADGPLLSLADHEIEFSPRQDGLRNSLRQHLREGCVALADLKAFSVALGSDLDSVRRVMEAMQAMGEAILLDGRLLFSREMLAEMERKCVAYLEEQGKIEVSAFRDLVGTTRKYAVPVLNYFDNHGVTLRRGDVRVLRGADGRGSEA